tara:strand:- start:5244 stop:6092 length:849 start_codon:yes stop_codon:yes gene_type:complete
MFSGEHKQTDIAQSAIFTTGSMRAARLYPSLIFALVILYSDFAIDLSSKVRLSLSYVFEPVFKVEYFFNSSISTIDSYFSSQKKLIEEIKILEEKINSLEARNLYLSNIQSELDEYKAIFGLGESLKNKIFYFGLLKQIKVFPDEILIIETDTENITSGMSIFNKKGLVGSVSKVFKNYIEAEPLHKKGNKIPAKIDRTLENIILVGSGKERIFFIEDFKKNADIEVGDVIISSGLGNKFPRGQFIGKVSKVEDKKDSSFLSVRVDSNNDFRVGNNFIILNP